MFPILQARQLHYVERKLYSSLAHNIKLNRKVSFTALYEGSVNSLQIEAVEKRYLLCGTENGVIAIYDLCATNLCHDEVPIAHIPKSHKHCPENVKTVSWYPEHTALFASSGYDEILRVWDTNLLRPLDKYQIGRPINSHSFNPISTSLIAVASAQHTIKIIDTKIGSVSHFLDAHDSSTMSVSWSPVCEQLICSGSCDGRLLLWDLRLCKKPIIELTKASHSKSRSRKSPILGTKFCEDNVALISFGADRCLSIWDARTGLFMKDIAQLDHTMLPHLQQIEFDTVTYFTQPCVIVPDGKFIQIVPLYSSGPKLKLIGHFDQINSVVCSKDGSFRFFSGGHDQSLLNWSMQP